MIFRVVGMKKFLCRVRLRRSRKIGAIKGKKSDKKLIVELVS